MLSYLRVAIGRAIGGVFRFRLPGLIAAAKCGSAFPPGTLVINVTGWIPVGLFAPGAGTAGGFFAPASLRRIFLLGRRGEDTTFSASGLPALHLANEGARLRAGANAFFSGVLGPGGVWLGHSRTNHLNSTPGF